MICAEYIWLDSNDELRSKTRILNNTTINLESLPIWTYDGSSTGDATLTDSEIIIKPKAIFLDPLRKNNNILVLCDSYNSDGVTLHKNNNRFIANNIFKTATNPKYLNPLFGIKQEYFLIDPNSNINNSKHYCGSFISPTSRQIVEEHLQACLYAKLSITGINSGVSQSQFEFRICDYGIIACDHLYIARYLLIRIGEKYNTKICFHPKPYLNQNGSGCHINFSTDCMRQPNGIQYIQEAIEKLSKNHDKHISFYGKDIELRLTGLGETSSINKFTYGIGNRGCSIRIPKSVVYDQKGYLEDRRPCSNINPYIVCSLIYETISN